MSKNFQRFKKRIGTIVVTTGMLIAMTITVNADTLNMTNQTVKLRADASKKCDIISTLPKGTEVSVLGTEKNWVRVEYNGQTGYIYKTSLETITKNIGTVKVGNSRLNVRDKASISGKIIGKLYTGDKVEIKGENGQWYKISYEGKTAYISKKYVKVSSKVIAELEECSDVFKAQIGFNVRTGPSTSYTQIGRLIKGQVFQVTGKCSNGWYQIKYGSKTGYVSSKYLDKMEDGSTDPQVTGTAKVNTKSTEDPYLAIRQGQGTDTKKLDQAKTGTTLEILADSNPVKNWTKVRYDNLTGYVYTEWLEIGDTPDIPVVKDEAPVITCEDEIKITVGDKLSINDLKLVVNDKEDGNITDKAKIDTSKVDTSKVGEYEIKITVEDSKGNKAEKTVKVIVQQKEEKNEAPTITAKDVTINCGTKLSENMFNAKAEDKEDGDLTDKITIDTSKVDTSKVGTYDVILKVKDSKGAEATKTVKVTVKATSPYLEASDVTIEEGEELKDSAFNIVAKDCEGNKIDVKMDKSKVDTSKAGTYKVTISAEDKWGNVTSIYVEVKVKEVKNEVPTISAKDVTIDCGGKLSKTMFNAKAEDKEDGDLTDKITIDTSKVDTSKVGTYDVILTVKDSKGAEATKTVKVTVKATSPYLEASDVTIEEGNDLKDSAFNIVAKDCEGNKIDVKIDKSKVDTSKAGTYKVTISTEDKWGNVTSIDVKVEVKEVKNEAPTISANDVTIDCGTKLPKTMFNAKAEDKEDGDLTDKITIDTSKVDTSKVGTYDVILTVKDSKGAEATKTVKVTVKATSPYLEATDVTIEEGEDLKDSAFNIVAKDCEGNKIDVKIDKSKVDTSKAGTYKVTISTEDKWGNVTSIDVKVEVKEKEVKDEAPVITADEVTIYVGDKFSTDMLNIKAIDKEDGDLTDKVEINGSVITNKVGRYVLLLSVTDSYGNETIKDVVVTVKEKPAEVGEYEVNSSQCREIIRQEMYRLVNEYRTSNGKTKFTISSKMQNTAWVKSKDMADNKYFSSTLNDKFIWEYKECEPADRENISSCPYKNAKDGKMTNEQCKELASEIFNLWKNAPKYNVNLLDDSLKSIGFDLYLLDFGNDTYNALATQEFHTTDME